GFGPSQQLETCNLQLATHPSNRNRSPVAGTKTTPETIRAMKARGQKIAALTAYDFPMTRLLDEAGVPLILVGDSLALFVLGYPSGPNLRNAPSPPRRPPRQTPRPACR